MAMPKLLLCLKDNAPNPFLSAFLPFLEVGAGAQLHWESGGVEVGVLWCCAVCYGPVIKMSRTRVCRGAGLVNTTSRMALATTLAPDWLGSLLSTPSQQCPNCHLQATLVRGGIG